MTLYRVKFYLDEIEVEYIGITLDQFLKKMRQLDEIYTIKQIHYGLFKQNKKRKSKKTSVRRAKGDN